MDVDFLSHYLHQASVRIHKMSLSTWKHKVTKIFSLFHKSGSMLAFTKGLAYKMVVHIGFSAGGSVRDGADNCAALLRRFSEERLQILEMRPRPLKDFLGFFMKLIVRQSNDDEKRLNSIYENEDFCWMLYQTKKCRTEK
jgi:hypothetical protein